MSPQQHIKLCIILLATSVALEITLLAGVAGISAVLYHGLHIALIAALAASQFAVFFSGRKVGAVSRAALWFAVGLCFCGVGDFINGAVSTVQPVSLKLSWALLLFGAGYALYDLALWTFAGALLVQQGGAMARYRYWLAVPVPVLLINVVSWVQHVQGNVQGFALLYYGSFIFNATIYVMMPTFAAWYFFSTRQSVGSLVVLVGALLIPYSDLILFGSWLHGGNPAVPDFQLYAFNWILYFGGQVLISLFPSLLLEQVKNRATA